MKYTSGKPSVLVQTGNMHVQSKVTDRRKLHMPSVRSYCYLPVAPNSSTAAVASRGRTAAVLANMHIDISFESGYPVWINKQRL